jgi:hypothetical protein
MYWYIFMVRSYTHICSEYAEFPNITKHRKHNQKETLIQKWEPRIAVTLALLPVMEINAVLESNCLKNLEEIWPVFVKSVPFSIFYLSVL